MDHSSSFANIKESLQIENRELIITTRDGRFYIMPRGAMEPVAISEGVSIYCPRDGRFSFFNSPYPAHHMYTGIDVYPKRVFGEPAPSPVSGRIVEVRRVKCPEGKDFEGSNFDYAILLKSLENPERLIKVLHVSPTVEPGEIVEPGQELGWLLRSGYFNFWTDPHLHVEVRKPSDPLRARGGFKLESLLEVDNTEPIQELRGVVIETKPEYSLVALKDRLKHGIPADVGGSVGLLDAGIPHYGWAGAHLSSRPSMGATVKLCGKPIATIRTLHSNMCLAECGGFSLRAGGVCVGLSLYLFPFLKPVVKLVPSKPGELMVEESRELSLVIA